MSTSAPLDERFADFKARLADATFRHWDDIRDYRVAQFEEYTRLWIRMLMNQEDTSAGRISERINMPADLVAAKINGDAPLTLHDAAEFAWACSGTRLTLKLEPL